MSVTWGLHNATHDLVIGSDGKFLRVSGAHEVRQRVMVTLLHDYQEYFLNIAAGTPWYELILGSKDTAIVSAILRQIVLSVPGVKSIVNFAVGVSNRNVTVSISLEVDSLIAGDDIIDVVAALGNQIELLALNQSFTYLVDQGENLINLTGDLLTE